MEFIIIAGVCLVGLAIGLSVGRKRSPRVQLDETPLPVSHPYRAPSRPQTLRSSRSAPRNAGIVPAQSAPVQPAQVDDATPSIMNQLLSEPTVYHDSSSHHNAPTCAEAPAHHDSGHSTTFDTGHCSTDSWSGGGFDGGGHHH